MKFRTDWMQINGMYIRNISLNRVKTSLNIIQKGILKKIYIIKWRQISNWQFLSTRCTLLSPGCVHMLGQNLQRALWHLTYVILEGAHFLDSVGFADRSCMSWMYGFLASKENENGCKKSVQVRLIKREKARSRLRESPSEISHSLKSVV